MRSFAQCRVMCHVCVRGTGSHHSGVYSPSEIVLTAACVLQTHMSIITVYVPQLSPFVLELMVKLQLLAVCLYIYFVKDTIFIFKIASYDL